MTLIVQHVDTGAVTSTDKWDELSRRAVEKALEHPVFAPQFRLRNVWQKLQIIKGEGRSRTLRFTVWDSPVQEVRAECRIDARPLASTICGRFHGTCTVSLMGIRPQQTHRFTWEFADYQMEVTHWPEPKR